MSDLQFGFIGMGDIAEDSVADNVEVVRDAVEQTLAYYNEQTNQMLSQFTELTTEAKTTFEVPTSAAYQQTDPDGNAVPSAIPNVYVESGLPIAKFTFGFGGNDVDLAYMTVTKASQITAAALDGDRANQRLQILKAIFDNRGWTYFDTYRRAGNVSVKPLANDDAQEYYRDGTMATADHYQAQNAAIDDANNPFPGIYELLAGYPNANGDIIAYIPTNLKNDVSNLANLTEAPDPNLTPGGLDASLRVVNPPFGNLIGYVDGVYIAHWKDLPSNYILSHVAGTPMLAFREHVPASKRGLYTQIEDVDGNHMITRFIRHFGLGGYNRTGAAVMQIGAADYTIPTGYKVREVA